VIQQNGDFSSDPHQNSRNFIQGKISGFWAQQSWYFWNRICISEIMSIWIFDVSQEDWTKKILVLLLELQLIVTPLSLNIFIQYFAVKWKASCWTKQHRKFFTGDLWTLVNRCYKATCFTCAFKHDDIANTYNSNSPTSIFLCKSWCCGDTTVSWSPMLIFYLQAKKILCLYNSMYPFKKFC